MSFILKKLHFKQVLPYADIKSTPLSHGFHGNRTVSSLRVSRTINRLFRFSSKRLVLTFKKHWVSKCMDIYWGRDCMNQHTMLYLVEIWRGTVNAWSNKPLEAKYVDRHYYCKYRKNRIMIECMSDEKIIGHGMFPRAGNTIFDIGL